MRKFHVDTRVTARVAQALVPHYGRPPLSSGDTAILKFLAAAGLIEAHLWQQYAELGGLIPGQLPVENV